MPSGQFSVEAASPTLMCTTKRPASSEAKPARSKSLETMMFRTRLSRGNALANGQHSSWVAKLTVDKPVGSCQVSTRLPPKVNRHAVKSPKRACRTRLPPKVTCQVSASEAGSLPLANASIAAVPSSWQSQSVKDTLADAPIPLPQRHSPPPNFFLAPAKKFNFDTSSTHKALCLPQKVTT